MKRAEEVGDGMVQNGKGNGETIVDRTGRGRSALRDGNIVPPTPVGQNGWLEGRRDPSASALWVMYEGGGEPELGG